MELLITVLLFVANWLIYQKMGRKGWESLIPIYNMYVHFEAIYGDGWKFLLMFIPIYNIYVMFKLYIDMAHRFHQSTAFGVGLTLVYPVFAAILAFGNAVFDDGSRAVKGDDPISETIDSAASFVSDAFSGKKRDPEALNKLEQLKKMHDDGILSDAEYEKMKKDIMDRV